MDLELMEEIDFSSDQGELDVIRGDVAVLNRYYDEISSAGGISRDQAKVLVSDCGVQFGEQTPVASFTEVPSRTNLSVAMEGMLSTAFRKVWELIKKAAALLIKITRWIIDALRKGLGLKRNTDKALAATQTIVKTQAKYATVDRSTLSSPAIDRAKRELAEAQASYDSNFNDLIVDMITDETLVTALRYVGIELLPYHEAMEMKLSLFQDLMSTPIPAMDAATVARIQGQLNTISTPIVSTRINQFLATAGVKPSESSLVAAMTALRSRQLELRNSRSASVISAEEAAQLLERDHASFVAPYVSDMDNWLRVMDRMTHTLQKLERSHPAGVITDELARAYVRAFDVVDREVQSMRQFIVAAESCRTVADQFGHDLFEVVKAEMQLINAQVSASEDEAAKAQIKNDLNHIAHTYRAA